MSEPIDLDLTRRTLADATTYAASAFPDGVREANADRRAAYNLIVYDMPALLAELRRLRAQIAELTEANKRWIEANSDLDAIVSATVQKLRERGFI